LSLVCRLQGCHQLAESLSRSSGKEMPEITRPRYHVLGPEALCAHCDKPALKFARAIRGGDIYTCTECRHNSLHAPNGRRAKTCCLRPILSSAHLGPARVCLGSKPTPEGK